MLKCKLCPECGYPTVEHEQNWIELQTFTDIKPTLMKGLLVCPGRKE